MKVKLVILAALAMATIGLSAPAYAACANPKDCVEDGLHAAGGNSANTQSPGDLIKIIVNALLYILGAVSVIIIIIAGIRYTISQGDSTAVTNAKNTILYAVIGLLVALFAYAIVNFVVDQF